MRAGEVPGPDDLRAFAAGMAEGSVSEAQMGAFAMAVCRGPGLGEAGRVALTEAMRDGGDVLSWDLPGPVVDKHSTGGVGDCVSLVLAPALAALGCYVPMISGRGLGHTGGTLDKLEAIPGLSVDGDPDRLRRIVGEVGCAIVGASGRIAPADARLYAVRDVTGTVESLDLITASILSKKLAAGLGALVLDVKVGSGAFMRELEGAAELAAALVETADGAGCPTAALLTDMDEPLAPALGNALEVAEAMRVLTGGASGRLLTVTAALGGALLELAGIEDGAAKLREAVADGRAAERFGRMVAAQGGPVDFVERWEAHLPGAPIIRPVPAPEAGHVAAIDGTALGRAVVALGGGRRVAGDRVDPAVGLTGVARLGAEVGVGDPLALVHAANEDAADAAVRSITDAIRVGEAPERGPLILARL